MTRGIFVVRGVCGEYSDWPFRAYDTEEVAKAEAGRLMAIVAAYSSDPQTKADRDACTIAMEVEDPMYRVGWHYNTDYYVEEVTLTSEHQDDTIAPAVPENAGGDTESLSPSPTCLACGAGLAEARGMVGEREHDGWGCASCKAFFVLTRPAEMVPAIAQAVEEGMGEVMKAYHAMKDENDRLLRRNNELVDRLNGRGKLEVVR